MRLTEYTGAFSLDQFYEIEVLSPDVLGLKLAEWTRICLRLIEDPFQTSLADSVATALAHSGNQLFLVEVLEAYPTD